MIKEIKWYIEEFKDWKNLKSWGRKAVIIDLIRTIIINALLILLGVALYAFLNNTGLLIYIILMLKYHWSREKDED